MTNIVDLPKQSLAITVWDHNKSKQNDYIGKNRSFKVSFSNLYFRYQSLIFPQNIYKS